MAILNKNRKTTCVIIEFPCLRIVFCTSCRSIKLCIRRLSGTCHVCTILKRFCSPFSSLLFFSLTRSVEKKNEKREWKWQMIDTDKTREKKERAIKCCEWGGEDCYIHNGKSSLASDRYFPRIGQHIVAL